MSDKPSFVRHAPRLTAAGIEDLQRVNGCRLASLQEVDRGVQRIVDALREEGALSNTAIIYTSDNGYLLGQHRQVGKIVPYENSLRVPLVIRVPPRFRGPGAVSQTLGTTVGNVDIAPTVLDLAGAQPCPPEGACRVLDGRSLLPAIQTGGRTGRGTVLSRWSSTARAKRRYPMRLPGAAHEQPGLRPIPGNRAAGSGPRHVRA